MAINYTKTAWVNGTPPAVNSTNLNKLEDAVKAAADACDSIIQDTGYKYPGDNTGQKIAAALTSAGYSIAPATGTASLDNIADGTNYKRIQAAKADKINGGTYSEDDIADGTTYKRIQAAKANAINGGTFDAASVLNFGIGQSAKLAYDADFNTLLGNGIYITYDGANRPDINYGILFCGYNSTDDGYGIQLYFNINGNGVKAYRKCAAGVWGSWITF